MKALWQLDLYLTTLYSLYFHMNEIRTSFDAKIDVDGLTAFQNFSKVTAMFSQYGCQSSEFRKTALVLVID